MISNPNFVFILIIHLSGGWIGAFLRAYTIKTRVLKRSDYVLKCLDKFLPIVDSIVNTVCGGGVVTFL